MPDNINQIKRQKEEKTKKIAGGGYLKITHKTMTNLKRGREADAKCCRGEEEKNQQETVQSKTALGEISFYP